MWMVSVFANRIVMERIVEMMDAVVLVVLVLPIKSAEMASVYASLTVEIENVEMMDAEARVGHAQEIKLASMENAFACRTVSQPLQPNADKTMVAEGNVLVLEGIV